MIEDKPLLKSMMSAKIWRLMKPNPEEFKRQTIAYFEKGYPGWTVVRVKYPFVFLRDDRRPRG